MGTSRKPENAFILQVAGPVGYINGVCRTWARVWGIRSLDFRVVLNKSEYQYLGFPIPKGPCTPYLGTLGFG